MLHYYFLSLGSNIGDRRRYLHSAVELLRQRRTSIEKLSSIYETEPVGKADQPYFLNQCIQVSSELYPLDFLHFCQSIENTLGRVRREKWQPRTIDIDILLSNVEIIRTNELTIPHPLMTQRRFVLQPLAEIGADVIHPLEKKNMRELLERCRDTTTCVLVL